LDLPDRPYHHGDILNGLNAEIAEEERRDRGEHQRGFRFISPRPLRTFPASSALKSLFAGVDLGALQVAAVVDVDGLPLPEHLQRLDAGLAVAVAGVLRA